jgi:hypothetical protein
MTASNTAAQLPEQLLPNRHYGWTIDPANDREGRLARGWHQTRHYRIGLVFLAGLVSLILNSAPMIQASSCGLLAGLPGCHRLISKQTASERTLDYLLSQQQQLVQSGQRATRLTLITDPLSPDFGGAINLAANTLADGLSANDLNGWGYKVDVMLPSGQGRLSSLVLYQLLDDRPLCQRLNANSFGLDSLSGPAKLAASSAPWLPGSAKPVDWTKMSLGHGEPLPDQACVQLSDGRFLFYHAMPAQ